MSEGPTRQRSIPNPDISDEDVMDAMQRIPGYLDITTGDFRRLYSLAREHALERMFAQIRADGLMLTDIGPVRQDHRLDEAARSMAEQRVKSIPVVDSGGRVVGVITESDFLRRMNAGSFLELMLRLMGDSAGFTHRCHETYVSDAMTAPPVTVSAQADFRQIMQAFQHCGGRALPVVERNGRFCGLLLRKDFIGACPFGFME